MRSLYTKPYRLTKKLVPARIKSYLKERFAPTVRRSGDKEYLRTDLSGKIVCYVFAGRRDRMPIMLNYLDKLVEAGQVDYVHIWNFARNEQDLEWVRSLQNKPRHTVLNLTSKVPVQPYVIGHSYYTHKRFNRCGLVKIDDDIVFMDVARFGAFRAKLLDIVANPEQDIYMVSANVLNGGFSDYYMQKRGLLPKSVGEIPSRPFDGNDWSKYFGHFNPVKIHRFFLNDPTKFLESRYDGLQRIPKGRRHGIAFVGCGNKILANMESFMDESVLTATRSTQLNKHIAIVNEFIVAHLSLGGQLQYRVDAKFLPHYRKLKDKMLPPEPSQASGL